MTKQLIIIISFLACNFERCSATAHNAAMGIDTLILNSARIVKIESSRMNIFKGKNEDIYKSAITFKQPDSSLITVNYRGQFPIPTNKGDLVLNSIDRCPFIVGGVYTIRFVKQCISQVRYPTYYSFYSAFFDASDCSVFRPKTAKDMKSYKVSYIHNLVDINNRLYKIDSIACKTK